MKVFGIDFTSKPSAKKPLTGLACDFDGGVLRAGESYAWTAFEDFEAQLVRPGPWIAGLDFPFGQARRFIENAGWPRDWAGYVRHAASLGKAGFVAALEDYKRERPAGDKEHKRRTDARAGSISPQKLYGIPVGRMFFEGAPRLLDAGVTVPGLQAGDPGRIVVEAYPGVLARALIGRRGYKNDDRRKQTPQQHSARRDILRALTDGAARARYGFAVEAPVALADDPTGDELDTLLCAVQAAWAWTLRERNFGMPADTDILEGWIADPLI